MFQIVFIKQVPSSTKIKLDPVSHTLVRSGVKMQANPYDLHAVMAAVEVKKQLGGKIVAVTMGPPSADAVLRQAIMYGADEGILVSDVLFAGSDTWSTSYILSKVINLLGKGDILWFGKQAIDGDTAQVGPGVAAQLGYPQLTEMTKIVDLDEVSITVNKRTDFGYNIVKVSYPVVITVCKEANVLPSIALNDWERATCSSIQMMNASQLDVDVHKVGLKGSPTRVVGIAVPSVKNETVWLDHPAKLGQIIKDLIDNEK
jgi:electron transfer flavoprotein beta subunit